jgi:hypothetical protein
MSDGEIVAEIRTRRHSKSPQHRSLVSSDQSPSACAAGGGPVYRFAATWWRSRLGVSRGHDAARRRRRSAAGAVGDGGIVSGLYSIDIRMLDGLAGGHTGVMLLHDGRILGGDAFFYYLGAYSSANGRWKGQFVNQEHTPAKSEHPLFGGYEVGIGFPAAAMPSGAEMEATALAGSAAFRFAATLKTDPSRLPTPGPPVARASSWPEYERP